MRFSSLFCSLKWNVFVMCTSPFCRYKLLSFSLPFWHFCIFAPFFLIFDRILLNCFEWNKIRILADSSLSRLLRNYSLKKRKRFSFFFALNVLCLFRSFSLVLFLFFFFLAYFFCSFSLPVKKRQRHRLTVQMKACANETLQKHNS